MKKVKKLRVTSLAVFLIAVIFGISSFATFNVRADEITEKQTVSVEVQTVTEP